ncbi:MAG TPA: glutathione S-transferase family protein [Stellaceae bacterium]|nr:glutathione S-transferase family protein [Stellaceae bacterium]
MLRLYNFQGSGNCYKLRLLLTQLGIEFERIDIDLVGGEARGQRFRARNPLGQTPFIEFDDGRVLAESNAILWFLAEGTPYLPGEPWTRALALQWMGFEQYRIEPNIGSPRYWIKYLRAGAERREQIAPKLKAAAEALGILDAHLAQQDFVAGDRYGIADIALYAYSHLAPEAELGLEPYPALQRWFARVAAQPRHIPITENAGHVIPWPEART